MKVELVAHTPYPLCVCAEAAAVCYDSKPAFNIIKGCIRSGHTSVLEHATFTFRIEGISRSCSHQIVRHRIASYSQ
jgi:thymidylate synthase (FAD)